MKTVTWLYRVNENDSDGDPLDFGAVTDFTVGEAARKLFHWLTVDLGLDEETRLNIYPVRYPTGVWKSEGKSAAVAIIRDLQGL